MPQFDSVTLKVSDGIKQGDYAPNKVYDLTGILTNCAEAEIAWGVEALRKAGEVFLGRAAAPATTTRKAKAETPSAPEPKAETPLAPEPVEKPGVEASANDTPAGTNGSGADLSDILGGKEPEAPPAKEITDEEVVHAVMARNEALKDAGKIRALVETYNPQPGLRVFKATEIAQADRAGFIEKLAALS